MVNEVKCCEVHIEAFEQKHHIPTRLLQAIALVESGRTTQRGEKVAWPWSINVEGKGYTYDTKHEAVKAVKTFQKLGKKSIDVGCMQINLKQHPQAFQSIESAFDPRVNVAYAAQFLNNLKEQTGNWYSAMAHYHSATPKLHTIYRNKVQKTWRKILSGAGSVIDTLIHSKNGSIISPSSEKKIIPTIWPKPEGVKVTQNPPRSDTRFYKKNKIQMKKYQKNNFLPLKGAKIMNMKKNNKTPYFKSKVTRKFYSISVNQNIN